MEQAGKWEYLTVRLLPKVRQGELYETSSWDQDFFSEQINFYAAQGWEVVSTFCTISNHINARGNYSQTDGIFVLFKRK